MRRVLYQKEGGYRDGTKAKGAGYEKAKAVKCESGPNWFL
jgi:hypothetical protein